MNDNMYDLTIIGGGSSGLFACFYAKLHNLKTQIIESLPFLGGQIISLFPEKIIYDIGGIYKTNGKKLIQILEKQLKHFNPKIQLNTEVQLIKYNSNKNCFQIIDNNNNINFSKSILIATGKGAFTPRKLPIEYENSLNNNQIFYSVKKNNIFKNQEIAIAGGGNTAIDNIISLIPITNKINFIYRSSSIHGLKASFEKIKNNNKIKIFNSSLIKNINYDNNHNKLYISIKNIDNDIQKKLIVDKLIVNYGVIANNRIIRNWNLLLEHNKIIVNSKMETNIQGIYAIGDAITYEGKVPLIATGFGEAITAINEIVKYLYPNKKHFLHSTDLYH